MIASIENGNDKTANDDDSEDKKNINAVSVQVESDTAEGIFKIVDKSKSAQIGSTFFSTIIENYFKKNLFY